MRKKALAAAVALFFVVGLSLNAFTVNDEANPVSESLVTPSSQAEQETSGEPEAGTGQDKTPEPDVPPEEDETPAEQDDTTPEPDMQDADGQSPDGQTLEGEPESLADATGFVAAGGLLAEGDFLPDNAGVYHIFAGRDITDETAYIGTEATLADACYALRYQSAGSYTIYVSESVDDQGAVAVVPVGRDLLLVGADAGITITQQTLGQNSQAGRHLQVAGSLTLQSITLTGLGLDASWNFNGGVYIEAGGSLTLGAGSTITKCYNNFGGGVHGMPGSALYIEGGVISDNAAMSNSGAGVFMGKNGGGGARTTLVMRGGSIRENRLSSDSSTLSGPAVYLAGCDATLEDGGIEDNPREAISLNYGSVLTMRGGHISGNGGYDGSIYLYGAYGRNTLYLEGGEIRDNTVTAVYAYISDVYMSRGTIQGNTGVGVRAYYSSNFTMTGGSITGNNGGASVSGGSSIGLEGRFVMTGGEIGHNRGNGATVERSSFLMQAPAEIHNNGGSGVRINYSSSFVLESGAIYENTDRGIYAENSTLEIQGGSVRDNEGIGVQSSHSFSMTGGSVTGNDRVGVYVGKGATFTLSGDSLIANNGGGGVTLQSNTGGYSGTLLMSGGTISGNTATNYDGGGVSMGTSLYPGQFVMTGGEISGNYAEHNGGGVYMAGNVEGQFTMTGGIITGNTAGRDGGGVYTHAYSYENPADATAYMGIDISGSAVVEGNVSGQSYLPPDNHADFTNRATAPFDGRLLNNDQINYVNPARLARQVTYHGNNTAAGTYGEAVADGSAYTVRGLEEVRSLAGSGFTAETGYTFSHWTTLADGSGTRYQATDGIPALDTSLDLYAQWRVRQLNLPVEYYFDDVHQAAHDTTLPFGYFDTVTLGDVLLVPAPDGYQLAATPTSPVLGQTAGALAGDTIRVYYRSVSSTASSEPVSSRVTVSSSWVAPSSAVSSSVGGSSQVSSSGGGSSQVSSSAGGSSQVSSAGTSVVEPASEPGPGPEPVPSTSLPRASSSVRPRASSSTLTPTTSPGSRPVSSPSGSPPPGVIEVDESSTAASTPPATPPPGGGGGPDPRLEQQTGNIISDIFSGNMPLGGFSQQNAWSLLSLMMALLSILASMAVAITLFARRGKESPDEDAEPAEGETPSALEEDTTTRRRSRGWKLAAMLAGLLPGILFLLLDDMSQPMVFINRWTLVVGLAFLVHMALLLVQFLAKRRDDPPQDENLDTQQDEQPATA